MLLATCQPLRPDAGMQNPQYDCFREKLDGEYPVFCFPARTADEFRFRSLLAAPCKPEALCIVDTDDYLRFDAVVWNNILTLDRDGDFARRFDGMFEDVDERFSEYVVKPSLLSEALAEVDIRSFIEEDEFRFVCPDGTPSAKWGVDEAVEGLRKSARKQVAGSLLEYGGSRADGHHDFAAIIRQNAFVFFLAGIMWRLVVGKPVVPIDMHPFLPDFADARAAGAWDEFQRLRHKVFDSALGGSHGEYLDMCRALEVAIGSGRESLLSRFPRNGPCPCMSGMKLKKCHGLKPVELFPFGG